MFDLTPQERKVVLFLISAALVGLGINFVVKTNSRMERFVKADAEILKININQATLEDLVGTKVLSSKLAAKIIEYRNSHSPFKELQDLKEIKGIGEYRYEKLKEVFYVK